MILTVPSDITDDTNLLNYNNSVKRMNKQVNQDLKNLANWLNANKICLNISKIEVVLFQTFKNRSIAKDYRVQNK